MKNRTNNLRTLTQVAILIALQAVLTFTPLGFILIPPVAVTILHIPVIIGGILLGPRAGAILGGSFGILSMIRAATSGNPGDILFNPLASGSPLASIVLAVLPRILLGLVAALLWQLLRRHMKPALAVGISAGAATLLHSFGVLSLMALFFKSFPLIEVFVIIVSVNCLIELAAAVLVSTGVCLAVFSAKKTAA